ncbi:TonB-dependent receptor [Acetobacteraceae bacterium]|nr:TonB-dependent receptor [Acetobacteraceae bacterium]
MLSVRKLDLSNCLLSSFCKKKILSRRNISQFSWLCPLAFCVFVGGSLCFCTAARATTSEQTQLDQKPKDFHDGELSVKVSQKHENVVIRRRPKPKQEVTLGGDLGLLGKGRALDTAFNVRSYTADAIANVQPETLADVLKNDPGVRTTYGYGNFSEVFIIRGFPVVSDDVLMNGLYGIAPRQMVAPQLYGGVQLLMGASTLMYGAAPGGSVGGAIDLSFKHAGKKPNFDVTGGYGSFGSGNGAIDMGKRFGHHQEWGVRMNFAGSDGEDSIHNEGRHSVALGLDVDYHNVSNTTRMTWDMNYQNMGVTWGRPEVIVGPSVTVTPQPVGAAYNYGQKWDYEQTDYIFGEMGLEHDFGKHLTGYLKFGGMTGNEAGQYDTPTLTNGVTGAATILASYVPTVLSNKSFAGGVKGDFRLGGIKNKWNFAGNALWEDQYSAYAFSNGKLPGNIYHQSQESLPPEGIIGGDLSNPGKTISTNLYGIAFADTASFWKDKFAITAGFRWQEFNDTNYHYTDAGVPGTGSVSAHYNKGAITPAVTALFHVNKNTSLYFNWVQALTQGPMAPSGGVKNQSEIFSPYRTNQYEAGIKYDTRRFGASLDFFQMEKANAYTNAEDYFVVNGLQQNQGIEIGINGLILPHLRFTGGATLIRSVQSDAGPNAGKGTMGIPNYNFNGNIEADVPWLHGATFIAGVDSTGSQWVNSNNTLKLPGWTILNLGVRHTFKIASHSLTARFNVNNVTDANYWSSSYGGYLQMGLPRTFQFSMTANF